MSTKSGRAPAWEMASVVAMNVFGTVSTVSPGCTPAAISAKRKASVPLPTPTQCGASQNSANSTSKYSTIGLQLTVDGRPGIGVVDEHHAVPDEDVVLDRHALADERVAGDLAVLSDPGVLLNLDEGADLRVVPHFAAVEVDEFRELDALTQL